MAILAVGLIGAMRLFPVGLRASQRAEMRSRATIAAQRVLESLKLKSWDELADQESTADDLTVRTHVSHPSLEHLTDPERLKAVDVTVEWEQAGQPRSLTFVTYVRREGR